MMRVLILVALLTFVIMAGCGGFDGAKYYPRDAQGNRTEPWLTPAQKAAKPAWEDRTVIDKYILYDTPEAEARRKWEATHPPGGFADKMLR